MKAIIFAVFFSLSFYVVGAEQVAKFKHSFGGVPGNGNVQYFGNGGLTVGGGVEAENLARQLAGEPFLVYTKSEIDDQAKQSKQELAEVKSDLLKAISKTVGEKLTPQQVNEIKEAVAKELRSELKAQISKELKEEILAELRLKK